MVVEEDDLRVRKTVGSGFDFGSFTTNSVSPEETSALGLSLFGSQDKRFFTTNVGPCFSGLDSEVTHQCFQSTNTECLLSQDLTA